MAAPTRRSSFGAASNRWRLRPSLHHFRSRCGETARALLRDHRGRILQVDGHQGYDSLADPAFTKRPWEIAYCWVHWRRRFVEFSRTTPSPICDTVHDLEPRLRRVGRGLRRPGLATALLDRLLHHAVVVQIEGASYRLRGHADLISEHVRANATIAPPPAPKRRGRPPKNRSPDHCTG